MSSSRAEGKGRPVLAALPRYLRSSVRSSYEVVAYLRRRGLSFQQAARAVSEYQTKGLIDDEACARLWADHWVRQGYASAAIRAKLAAKGFDARVIDDAAKLVCPSSDDEPRARLVLAQRSRRASGRLVRARLTRALASRGFDADLIERLLNETLGPVPSE